MLFPTYSVRLAGVLSRECILLSRHTCNKLKHIVTNRSRLGYGVNFNISSRRSISCLLKKMGSASCKTLSCGGKDGQNIPEKKMSSSTDSDIMEAVVCQEDELPEEGIKAVEVEGNRVLLVRHKGELTAVSGKCTHYGAPLDKGSFCNGRVRCPWHGACFNTKTGDIEDYPGLDSLQSFDVNVSDGQVKIHAPKSLLSQTMRIKEMAKRDPENATTFAIIGGGGAGASCVETLRQEGFTGRIVLISSEEHLPYDRPKLSKAMTLPAEKIYMRARDFYQDNDIELVLGVTATAVDAQTKTVGLSNDTNVQYDKLFIATGGRPRTLNCPGHDLLGIYYLRTPENAQEIANEAKGKKVVIIGNSFIGMETAAFLCSKGETESVTVVGNTAVPFERSLGPDVGKRIQQMFETEGVIFRDSVNVTEILGEEGKVTGVKLDDDSDVEADMVIVGIGVVPSTEILADAGVKMNGHGLVIVDEYLQTSDPDIFCGGDIASFPLFLHADEDDSHVAIGHWQVALKHGQHAACSMTGKLSSIRTVPFFWTVLFGKSLRYAGHGSYDDVIIGGDLDSLSFIAYYCKGDKVVAVATLMKDPAAAKYADMLLEGKFLSKEEILDDVLILSKL